MVRPALRPTGPAAAQIYHSVLCSSSWHRHSPLATPTYHSCCWRTPPNIWIQQVFRSLHFSLEHTRNEIHAARSLRPTRQAPPPAARQGQPPVPAGARPQGATSPRLRQPLPQRRPPPLHHKAAQQPTRRLAPRATSQLPHAAAAIGDALTLHPAAPSRCSARAGGPCTRRLAPGPALTGPRSTPATSAANPLGVAGANITAPRHYSIRWPQEAHAGQCME